MLTTTMSMIQHALTMCYSYLTQDKELTRLFSLIMELSVIFCMLVHKENVNTLNTS
jgi:hypothetical protein